MGVKIICPNCGRENIVIPKAHEWRGSRVFDFAAVVPKKCGDCGHIWEPPAPVWLLALGILLGMCCIGLAAGLIISHDRAFYRVFIASSVGFLSLGGSIARLKKRGPRTIVVGRKENGA